MPTEKIETRLPDPGWVVVALADSCEDDAIDCVVVDDAMSLAVEESLLPVVVDASSLEDV